MKASNSPRANRTNPAEAADATRLQPTAPAQPPSDEQVRARAYFLWEQAGRPDGDGAEFWVRAEQELAAQGGYSS
ncbi:MAG: DUF2934 domain-containing protein [Gemmataceae bacterium]|nr:DUF2934 domain-containing protein [Gemmataceae bacterium]